MNIPSLAHILIIYEMEIVLQIKLVLLSHSFVYTIRLQGFEKINT